MGDIGVRIPLLTNLLLTSWDIQVYNRMSFDGVFGFYWVVVLGRLFLKKSRRFW